MIDKERAAKAGLCAAGVVLGVSAVRALYKPLLATAAVVYVATRPPVKEALGKLSAQLKERKT